MTNRGTHASFELAGAFERWCSMLLRAGGYTDVDARILRKTMPSKPVDGPDILAISPTNEKIVAEVRFYRSIRPERSFVPNAVHLIADQLPAYGAARGLLITTANISESEKQVAQSRNVDVWENVCLRFHAISILGCSYWRRRTTMRDRHERTRIAVIGWHA